MKKQKSLLLIWLVLGVLLTFSLACAQSGEILTEAEATARAIPTAAPTLAAMAGDSMFERGDEVELISEGFLVAIYQNAGDRTAFSHAARGDSGTILGAEMVDDQLWYQVESVGGTGWVQSASVKSVGGETVDGLWVPGTTLYTNSKGYLTNLVDAPGSIHMIAGQERGVAVTVLEAVVFEDDNWYLVDSPTGQGWTTQENLSLEKPE
ncbi:MAG: hypothetical protein ABFS03_07320 [Chloroflexota bacterium]